LPRYFPFGLALLLLNPSPLAAQLAPVGVPKGTLRIDIRGAFESADRRLFDGNTEDYLADFGSPSFGSNRIPLLRSADSLVGVVLGQAGYRLNLGNQRARGQLTVGSGTIGAALGLTSRITLFANVPLVTTRVQARLRLDSTTADGGLNPAHPALGNPTEQGLADAFFTAFNTALATLETRIANGTYAGNPTLDSIARAFAQKGGDMRDALFTLTRDPLIASPFVPSGASSTGQQIAARIAGLQDTLANTLGVTGFTGSPVLAANRLTDAEFATALTNPAAPIAAFPFAESKIARIGDMDVGAVFTVLDRFDRPGKTGGFRLAVTGLLRLPTGFRDNPANLIDVGTGNGRYEAGVTGTADLGSGPVGTRLSGGYLVRFPTLRVRRVTTPAAPYVEAARLTNVRMNAGDVLTLGARPFLRLARNIAIHGQADYIRVGADAVSYNSAADAIPGVPASVMAEGSRTALAVGGGVSYVGRAAHECEPGRKCGWPVEAGWSYTTVVRGTGGRVEKFRTTRLEVRWYQRIWR
jgi:hypothetical protein